MINPPRPRPAENSLSSVPSQPKAHSRGSVPRHTNLAAQIATQRNSSSSAATAVAVAKASQNAKRINSCTYCSSKVAPKQQVLDDLFAHPASFDESNKELCRLSKDIARLREMLEELPGVWEEVCDLAYELRKAELSGADTAAIKNFVQKQSCKTSNEMFFVPAKVADVDDECAAVIIKREHAQSVQRRFDPLNLCVDPDTGVLMHILRGPDGKPIWWDPSAGSWDWTKLATACESIKAAGELNQLFTEPLSSFVERIEVVACDSRSAGGPSFCFKRYVVATVASRFTSAYLWTFALKLPGGRTSLLQVACQSGVYFDKDGPRRHDPYLAPAPNTVSPVILFQRYGDEWEGEFRVDVEKQMREVAADSRFSDQWAPRRETPLQVSICTALEPWAALSSDTSTLRKREEVGTAQSLENELKDLVCPEWGQALLGKRACEVLIHILDHVESCTQSTMVLVGIPDCPNKFGWPAICIAESEQTDVALGWAKSSVNVAASIPDDWTAQWHDCDGAVVVDVRDGRIRAACTHLATTSSGRAPARGRGARLRVAWEAVHESPCVAVVLKRKPGSANKALDSGIVRIFSRRKALLPYVLPSRTDGAYAPLPRLPKEQWDDKSHSLVMKPAEY